MYLLIYIYIFNLNLSLTHLFLVSFFVFEPPARPAWGCRRAGRRRADQMFYELLRSAGLDPGQDMLAGLEAGREAGS